MQQVWFAGAHADVGGGYAETGPSDIALRWVMDGAVAAGLDVDAERLAAIEGDASASAHEPLLPVWWLLGWKRRSLPAGAWIHESVRRRTDALRDYRPRLPADARFVGAPADRPPAAGG